MSWRGEFFEHAAFYRGLALRFLHGLPRCSEDLDFSLLPPNPSFTLGGYGGFPRPEIQGFGFEVEFQHRAGARRGPIESAFLKTNTLEQLIIVQPAAEG